MKSHRRNNIPADWDAKHPPHRPEVRLLALDAGSGAPPYIRRLRPNLDLALVYSWGAGAREADSRADDLAIVEGAFLSCHIRAGSMGTATLTTIASR